MDFSPVADVFRAMTTEQIGGHSLSELIGGGNPEAIGREILAVLIKYARPQPDEAVLDVGCGCGRIATALTQYMGPSSRYVGVDIVPGFIEFGRKFISQRYPTFHFLLLDQENRTYNWWRQTTDKSAVRSLKEL
jgi:SAM-dependent methyltransferase